MWTMEVVPRFQEVSWHVRLVLLECIDKDIHAISSDLVKRFEARVRSIYLKKISIPQPQGLATPATPILQSHS
jgi:hypothetical protein